MKRRYENLCRAYGTPSILRMPDAIAALANEHWNETRLRTAPVTRRPRVLFVGTDYEQDRSGTLQALARATDLHVFEHAPGQHGQRWPRTVGEFDEVRHHNGGALRETLNRFGPFDAIVGQMWGLSMHWQALAEARGNGISVVNIAMDDRHSWTGTKLPDGTYGGVRGIAPYLTLGLTDAPECVSWYEREGTRAMFFPEASDPAIFAPGDGEKEFDLSFVGANYGVRGALVARLQAAGLSVAAYGSGWPNGRISTDDVPRLFARSRIVLGSGTVGFCEDFLALKLRDFDGPMSGSMYVTHHNAELTPLFELGAEMATFRSLDDAVDVIRHYIADEPARERIAAAGRARCLRDHTWDHRVQLILSAI